MEALYSARDYKKFLVKTIEGFPNEGRGIRKQLAEFVGCQVAYVTQVLNGNNHFNLEQGEAIARFLQLNESATEYFLNLIAYNRAGTKQLASFYEKVLKQQRESAARLKKKLAISGNVSVNFQTQYYSSWHYAAVHMALLSPDLQTAPKISQELGLSLRKVNQTLQFLVDHGLATQKSSRYESASDAVHLDQNSAHIGRHHLNWRLKATQMIEDDPRQDLHYSGVMICSKKDKEKIQEKLGQCLKECIEIVRPSPSEEVIALNLDFFSLKERRS